MSKRARTAEDWRQLAVALFERAENVEAENPGSILAVELFARAGAAAAIATAIGAPRRTTQR